MSDKDQQQLKRSSFINDYYPLLKITKTDVDSLLSSNDNNDEESCKVTADNKPLIIVNNHHVVDSQPIEFKMETDRGTGLCDKGNICNSSSVISVKSDDSIDVINNSNIAASSSCKVAAQYLGVSNTTSKVENCSSICKEESVVMSSSSFVLPSPIKPLQTTSNCFMNFTPMEKRMESGGGQKKSAQKKSPKSKSNKMDKILKKLSKKTPLKKLKCENSQTNEKTPKSKGTNKIEKVLKNLAKKTPLKKNKENDPAEKKSKNETCTTKKNKEKKQDGSSAKKTTKGKEKQKKVFTSVKKTTCNKKTKDSKHTTREKNHDAEKEEKKSQIICKVINGRLEELGVDKSLVSCCVKAAMSMGYITLTPQPSDLQQVVFEGKYERHQYKVTLSDVIYQPDVGVDYEDGNPCGGAVCTCCPNNPARVYVTQMCTGKPALNSGRFHNHCKKCTQFGKCVGDYREIHCKKCHTHYSFGLVGGTCYTCERRKGARWVLKASVFPDEMLDKLCYSYDEVNEACI